MVDAAILQTNTWIKQTILTNLTKILITLQKRTTKKEITEIHLILQYSFNLANLIYNFLKWSPLISKASLRSYFRSSFESLPSKDSRRPQRCIRRCRPVTTCNWGAGCRTNEASASGKRIGSQWECIRINTNGPADAAVIALSLSGEPPLTSMTVTGNVKSLLATSRGRMHSLPCHLDF